MGERGLIREPATGNEADHKRRRSNASKEAKQQGKAFGSAPAGRQLQGGNGGAAMYHRLSTGKVLRRVPALRERCFGKVLRYRVGRRASALRVSPPGLVRQAVGVVRTGNAANPGWHGLQNTRSRHAAQTVEVVRNHEDGTSGECGSELPKGMAIQGFISVQAPMFLVISGGGRATVKSAAGHERMNPKRGESDESRIQRSIGALKERPGPRGQQSPVLTNWNRMLSRREDPEGQPATAKVKRGATNAKRVATSAAVASLLAVTMQP